MQLIFHFVLMFARLAEESLACTALVTIVAVEFVVVEASQPGAVYLWNYHSNATLAGRTNVFTGEPMTVVTLTPHLRFCASPRV